MLDMCDKFEDKVRDTDKKKKGKKRDVRLFFYHLILKEKIRIYSI